MAGNEPTPVPDDVEITDKAPRPETDPTLGIELKPSPPPHGTPPNRLVVIGDSLSHGFQSGAIFHTDLSYPAIIARELGWYGEFRFPTYPGFGGIPFNIEFMIADLEDRFGSDISTWESPPAIYHARQHLAESEAWWDRGPGSIEPPEGPIKHNLAIYGWDLRDALSRTADTAAAAWREPPDWQLVPLVRNADSIAALRVLGSARDSSGKWLTPFGAAAALGAEGAAEGPDRDGDPGDGIESPARFALLQVLHPSLDFRRGLRPRRGPPLPDRRRCASGGQRDRPVQPRDSRRCRRRPGGRAAPRQAVTVDFERLARGDALNSKPPSSLSSDLEMIGWIDQRIDVISRLWAGL